ncbi:hypothetical protein [Bacterioplanoides sp.]|uniref:hypothetical protein n=1 Tax=Bacterioplanoides sp. TaxID=2066072 RepID=UPI003B006E7D
MALFNRLLIALLFTGSSVIALAAQNLSASLKSSEISYIGDAYSLNDPNTLLYREEHHLLLQAGKPLQRQVNYYSAEGELIANKENWYRTAATQPDFILTDFRTGYREEAKIKPVKNQPVKNTNTLILILTESPGTENQKTENQKTEETQLSEFDYELVIDAGFDDFIRKHWGALLAGDAIPFSFASVARQTSVNFEVQIRKVVKPGDTLLKLEMTLRSSLLSWLMSPIKLDYDLSNKRLLRYRGLSNLQDDQGSGQQVDIRYRYFDETL